MTVCVCLCEIYLFIYVFMSWLVTLEGSGRMPRRFSYLHVVGSWDVGCSFEGVRHISQDLRGKEKVATVVAPSLQELQETPYDLRHALPSQGPLTLREMLS